MNVDIQLLIAQASKFLWFVQDSVENDSAPKNNLNTFWSAGDHDDPSNQKFSYNELYRANKVTTSLFKQVKLVLN